MESAERASRVGEGMTSGLASSRAALDVMSPHIKYLRGKRSVGVASGSVRHAMERRVF